MNDNKGISTGERSDFRNTLYQDLSFGVNQNFANTDRINCITYRNSESITIQIAFESALGASTVTFNGKDTNGNNNTSFGSLSTPLNGAVSEELIDNGTYQWWNMTIPLSVFSAGYWVISSANFFTDEGYTSEIIYISEEASDIGLGSEFIRIKYKNADGFEKDYYWTSGDYQEMIINCAHNSGLDFDTEKEQAEGRTKSELLDSNTRKKITRTILGVPSYLYEKIIKASYSTDLYINGEAMVCDDISQDGEQYDGLTNLICTYKEKNTQNTY